jgi:hypothetical protein
MVTMFDSTTPGDIPATAGIVAGYVDGAFAWKPIDWGRFPNAQHVSITVVGAAGAKVADVETGDLTPPTAAGWALREMQASRRPTLYSNRSTWPLIVEDLALVGIGVEQVDWWAADPTGSQHLVPGSVATQYAWPSKGSPGHYDLSVTDGAWPGIMAPVPKPPIVDVMALPGSDTGYWIVAADGGVFTFGGAPFFGSMGGKVLSAPIVAGSAMSDGNGYRLVGADGAVYDFGSAQFEGGTNT